MAGKQLIFSRLDEYSSNANYTWVFIVYLKDQQFSSQRLSRYMRVAGGALVGYLVANLLSLEGTSRGVLIVQSAMSAAMFNYLMAYRYHRSPEIVASLVVMSTLASFATLPLLLWLIL